MNRVEQFHEFENNPKALEQERERVKVLTAQIAIRDAKIRGLEAELTLALQTIHRRYKMRPLPIEQIPDSCTVGGI